MRSRILFVDDDPLILDGLRHRLRKRRDQWDLAFVTSGDAALAWMAEQPVDVVVSDMRMPGMDGADLLATIQQRYPRTIRLIFSGHADALAAMRAIPVAHQFLAKPSEPGHIESTIERVCALHGLINNPQVEQVVGRIGQLPSAPGVYAELVATLRRERVSMADVAQVIRRDVAICAKTLQFVNSAFFRLARPILEIEEAVSYLGFDTIRQIVLGAGVSQLGRHWIRGGPSLTALQTHSADVAEAAAAFCDDDERRGEAFVGGLLHDIGKLILAVGLPEHLDKARLEAVESQGTVYEAERRLWGVTHAEVGAYLLGLWGLPFELIEAVANHHEPSRAAATDRGLLTLVHVADALVHERYPRQPTEPPPYGMDMVFLERVGALASLDDWRQTALRVARVDGAPD